MSKYVTYYIVAERHELFPALMMIQCGVTDDGNVVYMALDTQEDATDHIWNCWQCYDSLELLYGDYPEMKQMNVTEMEEGPIELPKLNGSWS